MFKLSYEKIIEKISTIKNVSKEEIESKIQFKLVELQDLISKEGAAHIIANELGVNLFELESQDLKIKEIESILGNLKKSMDQINQDISLKNRLFPFFLILFQNQIEMEYQNKE